MKTMLSIFSALLVITAFAQAPSEAEAELYRLLNAYRKEKRQPPIPFSPSLTVVAQAHAKDLALNNPHKKQACNMHSWSDQGDWTSCCYTVDHAKAACMWNKPRELTDYTGDGYEVSYAHSIKAEPEGALTTWKKSPSHNPVLVNSGQWTEAWQAVGVGIYEGVAVMWFGLEPDSAAER
jgi:uncharacterized protein YkwD